MSVTRERERDGVLPGFQQEFPPSEDVHTVASLLKLYLRELPEPLVPFDCYSMFQAAVKSELPQHFSLSALMCGPLELSMGMEATLEDLQRALLHLSKANINVMKYLL